MENLSESASQQSESAPVSDNEHDEITQDKAQVDSEPEEDSDAEGLVVAGTKPEENILRKRPADFEMYVKELEHPQKGGLTDE